MKLTITLFGKNDKEEFFEVSQQVDCEKKTDNGLVFVYKLAHGALKEKKVTPMFWIFWEKYLFEKGDITEKEFIKLF